MPSSLWTRSTLQVYLHPCSLASQKSVYIAAHNTFKIGSSCSLQFLSHPMSTREKATPHARTSVRRRASLLSSHLLQRVCPRALLPPPGVPKSRHETHGMG